MRRRLVAPIIDLETLGVDRQETAPSDARLPPSLEGEQSHAGVVGEGAAASRATTVISLMSLVKRLPLVAHCGSFLCLIFNHQ
jgi:hypothetical protein